MDNRVMKLTIGWEEEPFALPFENCVPPAVHITGRQILDLILDCRRKERLSGCPDGTDSSVYRGDEPGALPVESTDTISYKRSVLFILAVRAGFEPAIS